MGAITVPNANTGAPPVMPLIQSRTSVISTVASASETQSGWEMGRSDILRQSMLQSSMKTGSSKFPQFFAGSHPVNRAPRIEDPVFDLEKTARWQLQLKNRSLSLHTIVREARVGSSDRNFSAQV